MTWLTNHLYAPYQQHGVFGCGNSWFQRYKRSDITKTSQTSWKSTANTQYPDTGNDTILTDSDFQKKIIAFCANIHVDIPDKDLLAPFTHESFLIANSKKLSRSYRCNEKLAFLGAQTMRKCVVEYLYQNFPELSAAEIWDVQNTLLDDYVLEKAVEWDIKEKTLYTRQPKELMERQTVLALVGAVYTHESPDKADAFVKSHLIPELTKDWIIDLVKRQHPKFILQCVADMVGHIPLKTKLDFQDKKKSHLHLNNPFIYSVSVVRGKESEVLAKATHHTLSFAEKRACQLALINHYPDEFDKFQLDLDRDDFVTEANVDLGLIVAEQRVVELDRGEESFGFHIKGGEKKIKQTEKHGGLSIGDRILAVNDRSVEGLDHKRVVNLLKSVSGCVSLTVAYCKEALIADEIEMKYKDVKRQKRLAELSSDVWSEWHQAQANKTPSQYKDVLKYHNLPAHEKSDNPSS
ncbi:39S ribosomal protein L44, mitochondrial [Desmophyllum pertusum]|uniref:39S ribosomal protein L44, mitochondrial n=1 Tax=Desmophyllum pertusum TaxID=174260 RepID=A0A9W9YCZ2_9CNID|nr:39S ribosomal protein L44, mitochondrial [Desmophyllum pertusum]